MRELPPYMRGIDRSELDRQSTTQREVIKNPTVLYGILLEYTRSLFSPAIAGPYYPHWSANASDTQVWIDTEYEYEAVTPEIRPAVYIWLPEGIKYTRTKSTGMQGKASMRLAEAEYVGMHKATLDVAWDVVAGTRYEAVDLASNLLYLIEVFSKPFMQEFCIDSCEVKSFNTRGIRKEEREKNICTIVAGISFQTSWTVKLESPKLKKVIIDAGQRFLDVVG